MKEYNVYFDAFGKKLKVRVKAETPEMAADYVRKKISIQKIEETDVSSKKLSAMDELFEKFDETMKQVFGDDFTSKFNNKK